jgi:hypothetical protein
VTGESYQFVGQIGVNQPNSRKKAENPSVLDMSKSLSDPTKMAEVKQNRTLAHSRQ